MPDASTGTTAAPEPTWYQVPKTTDTTSGSKTILDSLDVKQQKDMFLKLLVAQLKNQDPSSPMDQKDMMGQMAQFSTVEQLTNVAANMDKMAMSAAIGQSIGLIGKTVDYVDAEGSLLNGQVTAVSTVGGVPKLVLGDGKSITPSDVVKVS